MPKKPLKTYKSYRLTAAEAFRAFSPADWAVGAALCFAAGVIPMILKLALVDPGSDHAQISLSTSATVDFFSYYKSACLLIVGSVLALYLIIRWFDTREKPGFKALLNPLYIAAAVFALFAILSSVLSKHKYTAVRGMAERYESVFVLMTYLALLFAAIAFAKSRFKVKILIWAALVSCFGIGLIGFFQSIGLDPVKTAFFQRLIIGGVDVGGRSVTFNFDKVYSTLYNPNNVGAYAAMLLPLCAVGAVFVSKDKPLRAAFAVDAVLMMFCLVGSGSAGGFMGLGAAVFVIAAVLVPALAMKRLKIRKIPALITCAALAAIVCVCVFARPIRENIGKTAQKILDMSTTQSQNFLTDLAVEGSKATITTSRGAFGVAYDRETGVLSALDADGVRLTAAKMDTNEQTGMLTANYSAPKVGAFVMRAQDNMFMVSITGKTFVFRINTDGTLAAMSATLAAVDLSEPVRAIGFEGHELLGSGRGYIWSRTIPLISDHAFLGSGPDTFILEFPQNDIIGKTRFMGNPYVVVDKAHNLYMQTAVNTGLPSALALIFIFGYFIVRAYIKLLRGANAAGDVWALLLAVTAGVAGYAVASMSTDSTVSVAPVFWIVLGTGFALLKIVAPKGGTDNV